MKKRWKTVGITIAVVVLLAVAFWYGGDAPGLQGFSPYTSIKEQEKNQSATGVEEDKTQETSDKRNQPVTQSQSITEEEPENVFQQIVMNIKLKSKGKDSNKTQNNKTAQKNANRAVKKNKKQEEKKEKQKKKKQTSNKKENGKNNPQKQSATEQNETIPDANNTEHPPEPTVNPDANIPNDTQNRQEEPVSADKVTISILCKSLLKQKDLLKKEKRKYIPEDGVILQETQVVIEEGDTVFDVLQKATREHKIHLEFSYTPAFKCHYIEGISNIYEFDAGNLSGWMFCINDYFTGQGSSNIEVRDGDNIVWIYTCDLGKDVGDNFD